MAIEKPITDYEGTVALIKEIKKADAELQSQIDTAVSNEMKIAVGADGSNEMTFYKGTLL